MPSTPTTPLSIHLLTALTACSGPASQCKQFAEITQQSADIRSQFDSEIESAQISASGAQSLEELQAAAKEYTAAVDTLTQKLDTMRQSFEGINIDDAQLSEHRESYLLFISESKTALTEAGKAMQLVIDAKTEAEFKAVFGDFTAQANRAFGEIQTLDTEEETIIDAFNTYCEVELGVS
ncbi:MAG: hypothetical protein WA885_15920, partial [Phormidesmis sp.]